ncbi:RNA 2'-phosphotransferase [Chitinophaga silvatica]|uniref:Probable RNA 2'-phosphotransferase n=1 Tax=Chitinophaga silvatica TaxID=2282649 RepID=A0A3E1Y2I1_9BACT|nr:RNA 2'-phosphotransferase [Chitinophaga silvatica]RFS18899.1 RNA 2'-phosphotransferase [Chitinophaga silvatica]
MKNIEVSKLLSYLLRHNPGAVELQLDEEGWANVTELINLCNKHNYHFKFEQLEQVVSENDKQRFAWNTDKSCIRASQGHSIEVELNLEPVIPPDVLYHGTVQQFLEAIFENGIKRMNRQHIHLSATLETAKQVGSRRGEPVILVVDSKAMFKDGYRFYLSANGVWLTDSIPSGYLSIL